MQFTGGNQEKLSNTKIEQIKEVFSEFYKWHADLALPSQVDFMDSVYEQFNAKNYLSDKQIESINNILQACKDALAREDHDYPFEY